MPITLMGWNLQIALLGNPGVLTAMKKIEEIKIDILISYIFLIVVSCRPIPLTIPDIPTDFAEDIPIVVV